MSFSRATKVKTKAPSQETELLIESMQKLIDHMNENQTHQEEIFKSLTSNDVIKIIQNFDDPNSIMRKTSAAFLCELVYDNQKVQRGFCEITKILQAEGKVCVTKIPQTILGHPRSIPEIFEIIKSTPQPPDYPLCWYYELPVDKNLKKGLKYLKFERNQTLKAAKLRVQQFIDPMSCMFGFFVTSSDSKEDHLQLSKSVDEQQFQIEQKVPIERSQPVSVSKSKPLTQLSSTSQSPQHQIQGRKTVSVLNHSVDLGQVSNGAGPRYSEKANLNNKTLLNESEQFNVIKEEGLKSGLSLKSNSQGFTSLRDKGVIKHKVSKQIRK